MPLHIITGDIFSYKNKVDAIVVPANKNPVVGYGLDSYIYEAAGFDKVMEQRQAMGKLRIGQAKETGGFELAKYLIHTASPMWLGGASGERDKLKNCYINSMKCADRLGLKSIAFPLLSSGNMKFPVGIAVETAVDAINERLSAHNSLDVYLVKAHCIDADELTQAGEVYLYERENPPIEELLETQKRLSEIQNPDREIVWYLTNITNYITIKTAKETQKKSFDKELEKHPDKTAAQYSRERFYTYFDKCRLTAAELSKKIQCDKATVSRIKNGQTKKPQKKTVIALALAMELNMDQRFDFINCSGYSYPSDEMDHMIEQLLSDSYKNLSIINDILYEANKDWLLIGNKKDELSSRKERDQEI